MSRSIIPNRVNRKIYRTSCQEEVDVVCRFLNLLVSNKKLNILCSTTTANSFSTPGNLPSSSPVMVSVIKLMTGADQVSFWISMDKVISIKLDQDDG
jgi:hypothetical protein